MHSCATHHYACSIGMATPNVTHTLYASTAEHCNFMIMKYVTAI